MPRFKLAKGRSVELPGGVGLFAVPGNDEGVSVSTAYTDWLVAQGIVTVVDPLEQPVDPLDTYDVLLMRRSDGAVIAERDGGLVSVSLPAGSELDTAALAALSAHAGNTSTAHGLAAILTSLAGKADSSSLGSAASQASSAFDAAGAATAVKLGLFGDGSDGAVTFDGTTTVLGIVPSGSAYTLTRDLHLTTGVLNSGVTINAAGFRIFCRVSWTWNGTVAMAGANAAGAVQGAAVSKSLASVAGAAATTGAGASPTAAAVLGGSGGAGGSASGGGTAGGSGTSYIAGIVAAAAQALVRTPLPWVEGGFIYAGVVRALSGGQGGSSGAGDGTNAGGAGGAGGGIVCVMAPTITYGASATADVHGGNGGAAAGGNAGGGGSGGGGGVVTVAKSYTGTLTTNLAAGTAGGKAGTGVAGSAGGAGVALPLTVT